MAQECKPVPEEGDPRLEVWYNKATAKWEKTLGPVKRPTMWWGLYDDGELIAAYGMDVGTDGVVFVGAGLCEPSKRGLRGLFTLAYHLRFIAQQRKVRFLVHRDNRRMALFLAQAYHAKPVGIIGEIDFEGQRPAQ